MLTREERFSGGSVVKNPLAKQGRRCGKSHTLEAKLEGWRKQPAGGRSLVIQNKEQKGQNINQWGNIHRTDTGRYGTEDLGLAA